MRLHYMGYFTAPVRVKVLEVLPIKAGGIDFTPDARVVVTSRKSQYFGQEWTVHVYQLGKLRVHNHKYWIQRVDVPTLKAAVAN